MPQCRVCGKDVSETLDTPVGKTVAGTPELDPYSWVPRDTGRVSGITLTASPVAAASTRFPPTTLLKIDN